MRMTHEILQFADRCEGHKSKFSPYIAGDFAQFKILLIFEKLSSVARSMLAITRIRPRRLCAPPARRKQRKRGAAKGGIDCVSLPAAQCLRALLRASGGKSRTNFKSSLRFRR
jgi:hypothetical protein